MGVIYYLLDPEKLEAFELGKIYFSEKHLHDLDHLDDTIEGTYELAVRLLVSIGFGRRPGDVVALAHSAPRLALFLNGRRFSSLIAITDGSDEIMSAVRIVSSVYPDDKDVPREPDYELATAEEARRWLQSYVEQIFSRSSCSVCSSWGRRMRSRAHEHGREAFQP